MPGRSTARTQDARSEIWWVPIGLWYICCLCACSPAAVPAPDASVEKPDGTEDGQAGLGDGKSGGDADAMLLDAAPDADGAAGDAGSDDSAPDAIVDAEVDAGPFTCVVTGGAGCPCSHNDDCDAGLCVGGPSGGKVCAAPCDVACPLGWSCLPVSSSSPGKICVSHLAELCKPCTKPQDCTLFGTTDHCAPLSDGNGGNAGSFCASDCKEVKDFWTDVVSYVCPPGYVCQDVVPLGGGAVTKRCLVEDGTCP